MDYTSLASSLIFYYVISISDHLKFIFQYSVEFLISANAGQQPKPICKIASGGEMSRVMLALKT